MFLRPSKIYFFANKYYRLPKFSVVPLCNKKPLVLYLARSTASVAYSSTVISEEVVKELPKFKRKYFMRYLFDNSDKFNIVNTDNVSLEEETSFKSLKLLKDFLENAEQTESPAELMDCLKEELPKYTLEEIYKFIILATEHDSPKIKNPVNLFNKELLGRIFSIEDRLKILWVINDKQSKIFRFSDYKFTFKSVMRLNFKMGQMNSKQIVQLFLFMPRFQIDTLQKVKFSMQKHLFSVIPELNAMELAIIAHGFLRARLKFTHKELSTLILNKMLDEIENMNDIIISKISNLAHNTLTARDGEVLLDFQGKLIPHVSKFNEISKSNLVIMGAKFGCVNPSLWEVVADSFKKNIQNSDVHLINRMIYATVACNIQDEELLNLAIEHFKQKIEIKQDHMCLISFLYHLLHHNLYPEDLLGLILSDNFISQYNPKEFTFEQKCKYFFLNSCVEFDKPTGNFKFLSLEQRKQLFKVFKIKFIHDHSLKKADNSTLKASYILKDIFGKETNCVVNCLPHFRRGIVMSFDKNLNAQKFESHLEDCNYAKKALNEDQVSLFIKILPKTAFLYNSEVLNLEMQIQDRQLKTLGYKPVWITETQWRENKETRSEFLKDMILKNLEALGNPN